MMSSRISLIINGEPEEFFGVSRDLKQGDPLSPSLFAIAEGVLHTNLMDLVKNGRAKPMICSTNYQSLIHLLFANDIMIFANGRIRCIKSILELLQKYKNTSGQVMNKTKTKIFLGAMPWTQKVTITKNLASIIQSY